MNYVERTPNGITTTRNVVKLYDIVQPCVGFWKNELGIITAIKDSQHLHVRIIKNGMDMISKLKDIIFINHNTKTAAKSYFELCERMRNKFIAKYSNIDYIKEHFDDDPLICNDIVAKTICDGAGIYISNNSTNYSSLAVNWLAKNKELISAIIRIGDLDLCEKAHQSEIHDCGYANYIKLVKYFYGES